MTNSKSGSFNPIRLEHGNHIYQWLSLLGPWVIVSEILQHLLLERRNVNVFKP